MGSPGSAFEVLNSDLLVCGFELVEDISHPEAFGSRSATYRRKTDRVRLICDGRDDWLVLQKPEPAKSFAAKVISHILHDGAEIQWKDIAFERIGRQTASTEQIEALRAAVRTHFS